MRKLEELKERIENIEIGYDLESAYCDLINATIDYQNETQTWDFEGIFEDYINEEVLRYLVENNLKENGLWAVKNLLDDITCGYGVYRVDAYGYVHDVTYGDLEGIKQEILDTIESLEG